jgi:glycosyltransferase involved in cell wall biosynthesis
MEDGARPLVSVIVPTRNRCRLLPRALDSVLAQDGRGRQFDLEVVVVDDASSDETSGVMRAYPGVRYIRLERQHGAAAARNAGLNATVGPYIAFQDDDDLWLAQKLLRQLPVLRQYPDVGVVYSQNITCFEDTQQLWPTVSAAPSGHIFRELLVDCFCAHPPAVLARRAAFDRAGIFDEHLGSHEDYDMWLRLAFHFPFRFVPGAVAVYHASRAGEWQTSMSRGSGAVDFRRVIEKALSMLPDSPEHRRLKRDVRLRAELHIAHDTTWALGEEAQWAAALDVLRVRPEILRDRWGRHEIARKACAATLASDAPLARGTAVGEELRAVAVAGLPRYFVRLTMATVWAEVALALNQRCPIDRRAAGLAALRAIRENPMKLRLKALPRMVFRTWGAANRSG